MRSRELIHCCSPRLQIPGSVGCRDSVVALMLPPARWIRSISRITIYYTSYRDIAREKNAQMYLARKRKLLRRPVRRLIVPDRGQLPRLRTIRQHGPNLAVASTRGLEHDVPPVRSPAGPFVASGIPRDFHDAQRSHIHDVDVVIPGRPPPAKGQQLSVRGPSRIDQIPLVRNIQLRSVGPVGVGHVQLRYASAISDVYNGLSGLWVPCR